MNYNKYSKKWRLQTHDYCSPGNYFITINVRYRRKIFGTLNKGSMLLSEAGIIAHDCWAEIPDHFKRCRLGEFVIMPDHMHGILELFDVQDNKNQIVEKERESGNGSDSHDEVSSIHKEKSEKMAALSPKSGSVSVVIRSYKSAVTKKVREIIPDFEWHPKYYDRVIRISDPNEYDRIARYIRNNPSIPP